MANINPEKVVELTLVRGANGLGFNIRGGTDTPHVNGDTGIFVTKIRETGAAFEDGRLKEGDQILEINGKSLLNVSHNEAVNAFINAGDNVNMKVLPDAEARILEEYERSMNHKGGSMNLVILGALGIVGIAAGVMVFKGKN